MYLIRVPGIFGIPRNHTSTRHYARTFFNRCNDFGAILVCDVTPVCVTQGVSPCVRARAENRFSGTNDCLPMSLIKDLYI